MEDVGIFNGHLVNFPAIWHSLRSFGIFSPVWVHFTRFGMLRQEKSGNPGQGMSQAYYAPSKRPFFKWPSFVTCCPTIYLAQVVLCVFEGASSSLRP
jgi:hypothetical protein